MTTKVAALVLLIISLLHIATELSGPAQTPDDAAKGIPPLGYFMR
jgi:hypothetical protein